MIISLFLVSLVIHFVSCGCPLSNRPVLKSTSAITDNIFFNFVPAGQNEIYNTYSYKCGLSVLDNPLFNSSLKTIFFFHGFAENGSTTSGIKSCAIITQGFATRRVNLILVSYPKLVPWDGSLVTIVLQYLAAVNNIRNMGPPLGQFFTYFYSQCSCNRNTELIGFSLGAQAIHFASKSCAVKPYSITGLEAAGPLFELDHLSKDDGFFVQGIHTDGGRLGMKDDYGTIDFYPNGGSSQPECADGFALNSRYGGSDKCDHYCSVIYYANSVRNTSLYPSTRCKPSNPSTSPVYMGYGVNKNAFGDFCLNITTANP